MIREKDGIHFEVDGKKFVADSRSAAGDVNIVSHAHFDHLHQSDSRVVCSDLTARLAEARTGEEVERAENHGVELVPSGHILGSSAALFGEEKKYLYTGDVSTRDSAYLEGFQPRSADVLVVESTYGIPAYTFPDQEQLEKQIIDWVQDTDETIFLFGYSLGKAQKIQHLVQKATDREIVAHGAVKKMNDTVEQVSDLNFRAKPYKGNKDVLEDGGIFIGPPNSSRTDWVAKQVDKHDGVKAGFSGWAAQSSYKFRGGYDTTFPLSDHCDFNELIDLVKKVDPEEVYTQHGFDEALAKYLSRELGYNAKALKKNQTSLNQFG